MPVSVSVWVSVVGTWNIVFLSNEPKNETKNETDTGIETVNQNRNRIVDCPIKYRYNVTHMSNPTFQFPEVRVVEASAGSGKTYALAKRYIQLILNPKLADESLPIRQILALTFTNKAAYGMKGRILEFLKRIALGQMDAAEETEILTPIGITAKEAQVKAYQLMETVIHNYNYFQVQTIDKFINSILSGCAFKIGLTANFKIKTNASDYLEHALDQLIDQASHDKDVRRTFHYFLNNYLFIENRTGWFPKKDILAIITTLFGEDNTYGQHFQASPMLSDDLLKFKKGILSDIKELKSMLPPETHKTFVKSLDSFLEKYTTSFDVDQLSSFFEREQVPVGKKGEVSDDLARLWDKIRRHITELCEQESLSLFNPYIFIYDQVKGGMDAQAAKDDVLFLSELNKKAMRLFDEERVTVEELYYRLATRFHHYLVDEFQDTSRLQWRNIEVMVNEALSTGGSLFYVGDRKQAIYGFRGGDVNLFDEIKRDFAAFNVCPETLTKNWRSHRAVVDFNNSVFSKENLNRFIDEKQIIDGNKKTNKTNVVTFAPEHREVIEALFDTSQQSNRDDLDGGYVAVEYVDIANKEERDLYTQERFYDVMDDLTQRFQFADIAVLARSNAHIEEITNWLLARDIPVQSERTSNIQDNQSVLDIIAFLRFLESPIDNVSFAQFLLSDVFARATDTQTEDWESFLFELRPQITQENDFYIYTAFRKKYPQLWDDYIDKFFKNVGLYPLYELAVSFYAQFDCLKNFVDDQGFLMHLLELIKKQEEEISDLSSFLEYFDALVGEDLYVRVANADAVRVLTIHKSKGLEFPVVIIPFLGMDVQIGSGAHDNRQAYISRLIEDKRQLLRLKSKYYAYSDKLYQIYADEYRSALVSEINNVYVALTRARCELYAFVPKKIGQSNNLVRHLIPEDKRVCGVKQTYEVIDASKERIKPLVPVEYYDWMEFLNDEFLSMDNFKNRKLRQQGDIIHYFLSLVKNAAMGDAEALINETIQNMEAPLSDDEITFLKQEALSVLKDDTFAHFFQNTEANVLNEYEVVNQYGHTKRIDRVMVFDDEVWVIDYKYSEQMLEEYEQQVGEYMALCGDLYPGKKLKGFVLLTKSREIVEVQ